MQTQWGIPPGTGAQRKQKAITTYSLWPFESAVDCLRDKGGWESAFGGPFFSKKQDIQKFKYIQVQINSKQSKKAVPNQKEKRIVDEKENI